LDVKKKFEIRISKSETKRKTEIIKYSKHDNSSTPVLIILFSKLIFVSNFDIRHSDLS